MSAPAEKVTVLLPLSIKAVCAVLEGLTRCWPDAQLADPGVRKDCLVVELLGEYRPPADDDGSEDAVVAVDLAGREYF